MYTSDNKSLAVMYMEYMSLFVIARDRFAQQRLLFLPPLCTVHTQLCDWSTLPPCIFLE